MKPLTKQMREILRSASANSWYVDEDNFLDVAELVRRKFAYIYHDGECLSVSATDAGRKHALRLKIIRHSTEEGKRVPPKGAPSWCGVGLASPT